MSKDITTIIESLKSNPELRAQVLAALGVKEPEVFTPTWHADDKGMIIMEASGNPWSAANGYMSARTALRFCDRAAGIELADQGQHRKGDSKQVPCRNRRAHLNRLGT